MNAKHWNGEPDAQHNPNASGAGIPYVCVDCQWTGIGGIAAIEHHVLTAHNVRGRRWPSSWPNAQFCGEERRDSQKRTA